MSDRETNPYLSPDPTKKYSTRRYTAQAKHCSVSDHGSEEDESFEFIYQDNKSRARGESIRLLEMGPPVSEDTSNKTPYPFIPTSEVKPLVPKRNIKPVVRSTRSSSEVRPLVLSSEPIRGPPPLVLEDRSPSITQFDFTSLSYNKKSVGDCTASEPVAISHTQRDIVASLDNKGDEIKVVTGEKDILDNVSTGESNKLVQGDNAPVAYNADQIHDINECNIISPGDSLLAKPRELGVSLDKVSLAQINSLDSNDLTSLGEVARELEYVVTSPTIDLVSISIIGPAINVSEPVKDDVTNVVSEPEEVFKRALERAASVKEGEKALATPTKKEDKSLETTAIFTEGERISEKAVPCKEGDNLLDQVCKEEARGLPLSVELALSALSKDQEHLEAAVEAVEELIVEVALFDAMEDVSSIESVSEKVDISALPQLVRSRRSVSSRDDVIKPKSDVTKPPTLPKPKRISVGEVPSSYTKPFSLPAVQEQLEVVQEQLISSVHESDEDRSESGESSDDFFTKFDLFVKQSGVTADPREVAQDRLSHLKSLQEKLKLKNMASVAESEDESSDEEEGSVRNFVSGCFTITSTLHSSFKDVPEEELISCFLLTSPEDYCTDYTVPDYGSIHSSDIEYAGSEGSEGEISQLCLDLFEDT